MCLVKTLISPNCNDVSAMLSKTWEPEMAVRSVVEKGHDLLAVPVPSTALDYALGWFGQLQIFELRWPINAPTR